MAPFPHASILLCLAATCTSPVSSMQIHSNRTVQESSLSARMVAVSRLEDAGQLVAVDEDGVWLHNQRERSQTQHSKSKGKYGFYLHTYDKPEACINLLRNVRKFYPKEPVYIMSDGGMNFTGLCNEIGNCNFQWRPPANDRWNPLPFFNRFNEAAEWLDTQFVIMLEPDNEIRGKIAGDPTEDAGGLADSNPAFGKPLLDYLVGVGQKFTHHANFSMQWNRFGLAGGSYFKTEAALDAFRAKDVDWRTLRKWCGKKIWSSDVAMPMALASRGYIYKPWKEVTQKRSEDFWGKPTNHPAFRHYGRDEIKPFYANAFRSKEDAKLVTNVPAWAGKVACQGCVWVNDETCWKQHPVACPLGEHDGGPPW